MRKRQWELGLGNPAGEPKRNLQPLGVLQGQLHCHLEGLSLPVCYLPDKLHPSLSLQQCYGTEAMQLAQLRVPARTPTLQGHPIIRMHKMGWQPRPKLSSGCLQEKFGGTVTQFLAHHALKAKENFGDWTSVQPQVPVQRLYLRRMIVFHSSLLGVLVCNSFFFLGEGRRAGCASGWVANHFSLDDSKFADQNTEIFRWILCSARKVISLLRITFLLCLPKSPP